VAAAREGRADAPRALVSVLLDEQTPRIYRATAIRLLGRWPQTALGALAFFAGDADSLVRREAIAALATHVGPGADALLREALGDPSPAVRGMAARAAIEGWSRVEADAGLRRLVLPVLEAEARAVPDDDLRWFRLGAVRYLDGDLAGALAAYERQAALDPFAANVRRMIDQIRATRQRDE
jgi:hypothetical protein